MIEIDGRILVLVAIVMGAIAIDAMLGQIPQNPAYHQFADTRPCGPIPNCLNVLTNLGFVLAGFLGLRSISHWPLRLQPAMKVFWWGILLIGPGSAWYHWAPDDVRLVWDRLPMTVAFMGLFAAVLHDQFHIKILWLPILVGIGLSSIGVWLVFDDLRFYGLVQFLPPVLIILIFYLYPPAAMPRRPVYYAFGLYALAKGAEYFDKEVLDLTGWISGHSLKHLLAAVAVTWLIKPKTC